MVFNPNASFELTALLVHADQALYRAKTEGRNRLAIAAADSAAAGADALSNVVSLGRRSAA
jgi:hypothetical protein